MLSVQTTGRPKFTVSPNSAVHTNGSSLSTLSCVYTWFLFSALLLPQQSRTAQALYSLLRGTDKNMRLVVPDRENANSTLWRMCIMCTCVAHYVLTPSSKNLFQHTNWNTWVSNFLTTKNWLCSMSHYAVASNMLPVLNVPSNFRNRNYNSGTIVHLFRASRWRCLATLCMANPTAFSAWSVRSKVVEADLHCCLLQSHARPANYIWTTYSSLLWRAEKGLQTKSR